MANGISDILGVYRETLASERESRMGEMQMALSMMQFESERMFRDEGRRREDAYQGLASTKATLTQALSQDVSTVLAGLSSLYEMEMVDDRLVPKQMNKKVRKKLGLSESDETEIYNIVLMSSSDSATMQASAVESAKQFSERVSAEYKYWKVQEAADPSTDAKSPLLKSLTKAGILYGGEDKVRESLSFEPFLGVSTGRIALESVNLEMSEITAGDYEIQRGGEIEAGLKREPYEYDKDADLKNIADYVKGQLDLTETDEESAIADFGLGGLSDAATKQAEEQAELEDAFVEFKHATNRVRGEGMRVAIPDAVWNQLSRDPGTPGLESAGGPNIGYIPTDNQYQRIKESLKIMLISDIEKGRNELAKDKALKFVEWTDSRNELLEQRGRTGEVVKSMDQAVLEALGNL